MTINLSITAETVKDAIVVPASAVFKSPEGADIVLLAGSDGHAHVKPVQIGVRGTGPHPDCQWIKSWRCGDHVRRLRAAGKHGDQDRSARACGKYCRQSDKADKAGDSAKPAEKDKE